MTSAVEFSVKYYISDIASRGFMTPSILSYYCCTRLMPGDSNASRSWYRHNCACTGNWIK